MIEKLSIYTSLVIALLCEDLTNAQVSLSQTQGLTLAGEPGSTHVIEVSRDLVNWRILTTATLTTSTNTWNPPGLTAESRLFFRSKLATDLPFAEITNVQASGNPGSYSFSVTIRSTETGCDQYADWWEVLRPDGTLLYRRVLAHSHVTEQPFTRSGGPVPIQASDEVLIRAHMNNSGYGTQIFRGSPAAGFQSSTVSPALGAAAAVTNPLPTSCAF